MTDGTRHPKVIARCEGCGLGYEVDDLRCLPGEALGDCLECTCPVYVLDVAEAPDLVEMIEGCGACVAGGVECGYHRGFGAGWDACAAAVAWTVEAERQVELVGLDVAAVVEGAG